MNRKTFNRILYIFKESDLDNDTAWSTYLNCVKLFKSANNQTMTYVEELGSMTTEEKLEWRNSLAEKGIELTPSQVEDYILIVCLAIHTSWELNKDKEKK